jgi:lanthanide-dependent methanol dehydrogenase
VVFEGDFTPGEGYTLQRQAGPAQRRWFNDETITWQSWLAANDPVNSRTEWFIQWEGANAMPVMATAGDLLFQGGLDMGVMRAMDVRNGEIVWEYRTGSRFNQTPITYLGPDGRQYVAIIASSAAANAQVAVDTDPDNANRYRRSGSTLYVWALPQTVAGN